jgi:hypothetical protein
MAHDSDAMVSITEDLWHTLTEVQYAAVPSREDMELYGQAMTAIALVYGPNALDYDPRMINGILTRYTRVR